MNSQDIGEEAARGLAPSNLPGLSVVVIARNEAEHIGLCLKSLIAALKVFPDASIVLVDSNSTDETVSLASAFPVTIYRYVAPVFTAAAGRKIGFDRVDAKYVLFIDGDCCLEQAWLQHALDLLENSPDAALIHGARREVFEGVSEEFQSEGPKPEEYGIGGNALYRSSVLREIKGFNPFIVAEEEGELYGRIRAAGYRAIRTPDIMFFHYTQPKDTIAEVFRRYRSGLSRGRGQVLRLSISQALFGYHARRFNRYLLTLAYLIFGVVSFILGAIFSNLLVFSLWIATGIGGFIWLVVRRRSLRAAMYILMDWLLVGINMVPDFLRRPKRPETFKPVVERIK